VLPLVRDMQARATSEQPRDANLRAAHSLVVEYLDTAERGFPTMAEALDAYDPVQYEPGFALWGEADQIWAQWRAAVNDLSAHQDASSGQGFGSSAGVPDG
jgi:hypothetical protein